MDEDEGTGIEFKGALDNLTRIDRDMVNRAAGLFFIRDQDILAVKEQDPELFNAPVCHGGAAIGDDGVPA